MLGKPVDWASASDGKVDPVFRCGQCAGKRDGAGAAIIDEAPKVLDPALRPAVIDSTFRNGSLAVMSVVGGFSLGFLSRWAGLPGPWTPTDLFAVAAITLGIVLQVKALADMLSVKSLLLEHYNRTVRISSPVSCWCSWASPPPSSRT